MGERVSVIVCAYTLDRWDDLTAAIGSLRAQQRRPDETVLVIDKNDALLERARAAFDDVRVVPNTGTKGLSGARNSGVAAATGELLVFFDDDATAGPEWLDTLLAGFDQPDVVGVGGSARPDWPGARPTWFPAEFEWVVGCSFEGTPTVPTVVRNVWGCNMALRRDAVEAVGGFSDGLGRLGRVPLGAEETELCIRIGQRFPDRHMLYLPAAQVRQRVTPERATVGYFLRRCWAEGVSKARVTQSVGAGAGLSAERDYTRTVLPRAVARGLRHGVTGDVSGFGRALAVVAGLAAAALGYLRGTVPARASRGGAPARRT